MGDREGTNHMIRELTLNGLSKVDGGRVDEVFRRHLSRAIADCEDRPGDKTKRVVQIAVLITPDVQQDGAVTDVNIECEVSSKVPKHISRTINCAVRSNGRAVFNDLSQDDIDQRTLDEQTVGDDDDE